MERKRAEALLEVLRTDPSAQVARDFAKALREIEQIGHGKIPGACGDIAEKALDLHPGWDK